MTRTCAYIKCNNEFEPTSKYNPNQKYCCRLHSNYQWLIDNPIKKKNIKKKYDNSKHGKAKNFANKLKRIFNITVEEYNKMFKEGFKLQVIMSVTGLRKSQIIKLRNKK